MVVRIAAPILRGDGTVLASISILVVRSLVSENELEDMAGAIVEAARGLSDQVALLEL